MARRRASGLGWIVVLVTIGGAYNLLAPHSPSTIPANTDAVTTPLFSRSAASPPSADQKPAVAKPKMLYVTATALNVRASPTANGTVLLAAPRGTSVIAISQQDGWYEVKLTNGSTGWMNGTYLSEAALQQRVTIAPPAPVAEQIDREDVVRAIIAESLASYPGNCACPYNTDRAGRSCGRRSAWSKAGGYAPLC